MPSKTATNPDKPKRERREETSSRDNQILELIKAQPRGSVEIWEATGVSSYSKVYGSLCRLRDDGLIVKVRDGGRQPKWELVA